MKLLNGSYWIVGGKNTSRESIIFDGVSSMSPGPGLPEDFVAGCIVNINIEETLIVQRNTFIYNHRTNEFTRNPTNPAWQSPARTQDWSQTTCALSLDSIGSPKYVVMAGGWYAKQYVQIFNIVTKTWTNGVPLPTEYRGAAVVPFKRSFLIVGGGKVGTYSNKILEFDPDNLDWLERSETLPHGIAHSYATMISDEQAGC